MINKKKFVAVIGGGECSKEEARLAEAVGRELARQGAILVCGGLGGVMEAACRGASTEGGITIGILPGDTMPEMSSWSNQLRRLSPLAVATVPSLR
jgi:uncharacterized protein (TIGR00725 family)